VAFNQGSLRANPAAATAMTNTAVSTPMITMVRRPAGFGFTQSDGST